MTAIGSLVECKEGKGSLIGGLGVVIGESGDDYQIALLEHAGEGALALSVDDLESGDIAMQHSLKPHMIAWTLKSKSTVVGRLKQESTDTVLRAIGREYVRNYYEFAHYSPRQEEFVPGESPLPYGGRVYDAEEIQSLFEATLDFWLTTGRFNDAFEKGMREFLGVKYVSTTNSGSSANLLAVAALTSSKLGDRRFKPGDEVITVAAAFPTTISPLLQYGLIPVFVDVDLPTYNIKPDLVERAVSEKTRAIMIAHTLGNPFDLQTIMDFCEKHKLWLIEDNCDALGSRYFYNGEWRYTGTIGHLSTASFYPAHHITMGEGGAVCSNDGMLHRLVESFRDWGRDCWCPSGRDNTCGKRFDWQLGELPYGYDHKYIYSHFGYNLKVTDMQAAIGCAQLKKLPVFIEARQTNWKVLRAGLDDLGDRFILPEATPKSDPSWFGFLLTVREGAGFSRDEIIHHLENDNIQTRMLFAGNLLQHPCFDEMRAKGEGFRVVGDLNTTDKIMNSTFWIGVYPGMNHVKIEYIIDRIRSFVKAQ